MAQAYIETPQGVIPVDAIQMIGAPINPDNSYSFAYYTNPTNLNAPIYINSATFPTIVEALQAGYNTLVIQLP